MATLARRTRGVVVEIDQDAVKALVLDFIALSVPHNLSPNLIIDETPLTLDFIVNEVDVTGKLERTSADGNGEYDTLILEVDGDDVPEGLHGFYVLDRSGSVWTARQERLVGGSGSNVVVERFGLR
jgi:hypothetical protein